MRSIKKWILKHKRYFLKLFKKIYFISWIVLNILVVIGIHLLTSIEITYELEQEIIIEEPIIEETIIEEVVEEPQEEEEIIEEEISESVIEPEPEPEPVAATPTAAGSYMTLLSTSSVKTYMNYKLITSTTSAQYKYIKNYMTVDQTTGLLKDSEGYIGVALGSYFGAIGSKFIVTLDTGTVLKLVKVEAKADSHCVDGFYQKWDGSIIEFVIDTAIAGSYYGKSSNGYVASGNFNNIAEFKGKIKSIQKL